MVKSPSVRRSADSEPHHQHKSSRGGGGGGEAGAGGASPFKHAFDAIARVMPASAEAVVVTTMPRGSLQLAQPARLNESLLKNYVREFHLEDRLTWQAGLHRKPVTASQAASPKFVGEFLQPAGFAHAVAVPLEAPVLEGYPGALQVYRKAEDGDFAQDEIRKIQEIARELDAGVRHARETRNAGSNC